MVTNAITLPKNIPTSTDLQSVDPHVSADTATLIMYSYQAANGLLPLSRSPNHQNANGAGANTVAIPPSSVRVQCTPSPVNIGLAATTIPPEIQYLAIVMLASATAACSL